MSPDGECIAAEKSWELLACNVFIHDISGTGAKAPFSAWRHGQAR